MAQLVVAAAGAAVGSLFGPLGTQIGWAVGSMVGATFGPTQRVKGPRLQDLRVTGTEYGEPIPWVAGHPRVSGQVWWASDRREIATTTEQGKGGGGGVSQTTYTYEVDILYGLCDRPIDYIARVWSNGALVWTALNDSDLISLTASQTSAPWDELTILTGASDSQPWATYEAAVGVGNAPAYRGRGAVGIRGLQLGNSGVIPNLTFEVVVDGVITNADAGFLNQFDEMTDASNVTSTLGPDVSLVTGAAALQSVHSKWGGSALSVPMGSANLVQTPILSQITQEVHLGKSWRWEFWAYFTDYGGQPIKLRGTTGINQGVEIGAGVFAAYNYQLFSDIIGGGGGVGTVGQRPNLFEWTHIAIEQQAGGLVKVFDSRTGFIGNLIGAGSTWDNTAFGQLTIDSPSTDIYVDSMLFRWFEADEEDELYAVGGYAVPTGPFEPPPYAYTVVDPNDETLRSVVDALCTRAGMPAGTWDSSALAAITTPVRAFSVAQTGSTRAALETLMAAYFFEAYSTDKLYFVPRAGAVALTVSEDNLGSGLDGPADERLPLLLGNDLEVPAQVSLSYSNADADYTTATEHSDRLLSGQASTSAVQMPLALTSAEAKGIADAILVDGLASRVSGSMALPISYAQLVPTDVVTVPDDEGNTYRARIVRRTDAGPLATFDWVLDDATAIESAGITSTDYAPSVSVSLPGDTTMVLMDIPLLRDADDTLGHYVAASSSATMWPGAGIYRSADGVTYDLAATVSERAIVGTTSSILPNFTRGSVFDETSTVTVVVGVALTSTTRTAMLSDRSINVMLIGSEVIRYRTATLVSAGVYTLSGLLRGQLGTEWAMSGHLADDRVVMLRPQGLRYLSMDAGDLSKARSFKGVTLGAALADVSAQTFSATGISSKPLAPVQLRRAESGADIVLTWHRRTRLSSSFTGPAGSVVPLGELSEAYDVELTNGGTLVSVTRVTSPTVTLTGALSGYTANVYQISDTIGRGYPATIGL